MPPKKAKKARPKKPWQKVLDLTENYTATCKLFDSEPIETIEETYRPIIAKKGKKVPMILQFADTEVLPTQIRPLIETLKKSEVKVKILSFLQTQSGDSGLHVLAHAFDEPLEIVGLAYHSNDVGPSGCRGLARSMVKSKFLAILELDFNPGIGDDGVKGLTHYGHCPTLNRLSLKFCNIGDAGAATLGKWIAEDGCQLKELYLNGNRIGPEGATQFAEGLGKNKTLNRVELNDNIFGYDHDAMNALHDGIQACPTLQYVNLLNNFEISDEIGEKFLELTRDKPLGECVLSPKMNTAVFQNIKAISLTNKRKMVKEAKRLAREARKKKPEEAAPAADAAATPAPANAKPELTTTGTTP